MLWLLMFVYIGTGDSVYIISVAENVLQLVCVDGVCLIKCARDHTLFVINHQIGEVFRLWYALICISIMHKYRERKMITCTFCSHM